MQTTGEGQTKQIACLYWKIKINSLEKDKIMFNLQPLKVSTLSESVFVYVTVVIVPMTSELYMDSQFKTKSTINPH